MSTFYECTRRRRPIFIMRSLRGIPSAATLLRFGAFGLFLTTFVLPTWAAPGSQLALDANGCSYYVSESGSDDNPGTLTAPWQSIQHAAVPAGGVKPGDVICVRDGVYGSVTQAISGKENQLIIYKNFPGENPIVRKTWIVLDQSYIRIQGFTFDQPAGRNTIVVHIRAVNANIYAVEILDNIFINTPAYDSLNHIRASTKAGAPYSIQYLRIEGNDISDRPGPAPEGDKDRGETIQLDGNVDRFWVIGNVLRDPGNIGIGIVGGYGDADQPDIGIIRGNTVYEHSSPGKTSGGIYFDGAGFDFVVEDNLIYDGFGGIKIAAEEDTADDSGGRMIIRRNVAYNNANGGNSMLGSTQTATGPTAGDCADTYRLRDVVAVHNTFHVDIDSPRNARFRCIENLRYLNNILSNTYPGAQDNRQYSLTDSFSQTGSWLLDHNLFFSGSTPKQFEWLGLVYDDLGDFQAATGLDSNSFEANPRFVDAAGRDFQLQPDSPAIDAGAPLTFTRSAGSGTSLPVEDARFFSDGLGLQPGDLIRIGGDSTGSAIRITAVDLDTNSLTLASAASWGAGDPVSYDYAGLGPDLGAFEFDGAATPPTFTDVPTSHPYFDEIELLYQLGYSAGCAESPLRFCPEQAMNRAESAVFVQRGLHGADVSPSQPGSQTFADVALSEWYADWAQALWDDGYTTGCGVDPLRYCPLQGHTRAEGAVFYLRMLYGVSYQPPAPQGLFDDVSTDAWYADWVEAAYDAGLIEPCGQNPLRYCPEAPLTRATAAYMLVQAKGLLP